MKVYQVFEAQEEWVDHYYGDTNDCNLEVHNHLIKILILRFTRSLYHQGRESPSTGGKKWRK